MSPLQIMLLGRPEVWWQGRLLGFRTRKALALLAYLAVEGNPQPRARLAELFWPAGDPTKRRAMLRTSLQHMRQALPADILLTENDQLGLAQSADLTLDVDIFARAVQAARRTQPASREVIIAELEAAVALYRGPFMHDIDLNDAPEFDQWLYAQQQRWSQHAEAAFDTLTRLHFEAGDLDRALAAARRWSAAEPLSEAAAHWQMRSLFSTGQPAAAIRVFEAHAARLERELSVRPAPALIELAERIRRHETLPAARGTWFADDKHAPDVRAAAPMVGRAPQIAQIIALLHAFRAGQPQAALIIGEAGIGKTRLAAEAARQAIAEGLEVWEARAFEAAGHVSYQVVLNALRQRVERENAPVDLLSDVWLAELSRLLPELRERYPDLPQPLAVGEGESQARLFEAIARLTRAIAARTPVVLFIDDAQWTDSASRDLLHYLARQYAERRAPVLLLLTVRAEDSDTPELAAWLADLGRALPITRIELLPLALAHTQQWVQALAGYHASAPPAALLPAIQAFSAWLYQETGGHPFFLTETLRTMRERGLIGAPIDRSVEAAIDVQLAAALIRDAEAVRAALGIPSGVRDIIRARLQRLSASAAELLAAAATLGDAAGFDILLTVAALDERDGLRALDELLAARLIQERTSIQGTRYLIAHDKIRAVSAAAASDARRRVLHRRAFEALQADRRTTAATLAYHASAAQLRDASARWNMAAGDAAMELFDLRRAIMHYTLAQEALGGALETIDPLAYLRLGRAYELVGETQQAQQAYEHLLAVGHVAQAPALEISALSRLATLAVQVFDLERMHDLLAQMLASAQLSHDLSLQAQVEWTLAQTYNYLAQLDQAQLHGERARALAGQIGDEDLLARSLNVLAYIYNGTYQAQKAWDAATQSHALYATLGNAAMESDSLAQVACAEMRSGRPQAAVVAARRSRERAEAVENSWGIINADVQLAVAFVETGELGLAEQCAEHALLAAQTQQIRFLITVAQLALGMVLRVMFDLERAHTVLSSTLTLPIPQSLATRITIELCAVHALRGDWANAYNLVSVVQTHPVHPLFLSGRAVWLETAALLRIGAIEQAGQHVGQLEQAMSGSPRARLDVLRAAATLALFKRQRTAAIEHLQEAAEAAQSYDLPLEHWQILVTLERAYRASGDQPSAKVTAGQVQAALGRLVGSIPNQEWRQTFTSRAREWIAREEAAQ